MNPLSIFHTQDLDRIKRFHAELKPEDFKSSVGVAMHQLIGKAIDSAIESNPLVDGPVPTLCPSNTPGQPHIPDSLSSPTGK